MRVSYVHRGSGATKLHSYRLSDKSCVHKLCNRGHKKTRKGNGWQQGRKTRVGSVKHKRNATEAEHDRRGNQKKERTTCLKSLAATCSGARSLIRRLRS